MRIGIVARLERLACVRAKSGDGRFQTMKPRTAPAAHLLPQAQRIP